MNTLLRAALVLLALIATVTPARAQRYDEPFEEPPKDRVFSAHGYFRLRTDLFHNLDLGVGPTPGGSFEIERLEWVQPDVDLLEQNRIVIDERSIASAAYKVLRTRVLQRMRRNRLIDGALHTVKTYRDFLGDESVLVAVDQTDATAPATHSGHGKNGNSFKRTGRAWLGVDAVMSGAWAPPGASASVGAPASMVGSG